MPRDLVDHLRRQPVAYLALFVALGGTSYAAARLPANSVGAKQIRSGAVTSSEVRNGSLLATDFKLGQLPAGPRGQAGQPGPAGPQGPAGAPGPAGTAAPAISIVKANDSSASNSDSFKFGFAECPAGSKVVATSGQVLNNTSSSQQENVALTGLEVDTFSNAASIVAQEVGSGTTTNWSVEVTAICLRGIS